MERQLFGCSWPREGEVKRMVECQVVVPSCQGLHHGTVNTMVKSDTGWTPSRLVDVLYRTDSFRLTGEASLGACL